METENNVVTINGQEYIEDNLNEGQRYFINQVRDLQLKANSLRFQLDQVVVAQDKLNVLLCISHSLSYACSHEYTCGRASYNRSVSRKISVRSLQSTSSGFG